MPATATTQCRVTIVAPNGFTMQFSERSWDLALLAVETHKDLQEAVGSFTLHFTATVQRDGRRWDEIIPKRSLVVIEMHRDDPALPTVNPTVMVGLTDDHGVQESWESAHPRRQVQVSGREMSGLLLDAQLIYNQRLALDPSLGTMTMTGPWKQGDVREMALYWDPNIPKAGESPQAIISRILDYFLFVGGAAINARIPQGKETIPTSRLQRPVIQIDLPEFNLPELLVKNEAQWNTFEPVFVSMPYAATEVGSIWNYLHLYIDTHFQEFFTRVEDGVCNIHFRGKPFLHTRVTSGTRFKDTSVEPTLQTLRLNPDALLSRLTQCQTANVYNYFVVYPGGVANNFQDPAFLYRILPQVVKEPEHPSFVGRYGLRVMQAKTPYLAPFERSTPPAGPPGGDTEHRGGWATPKPLRETPAGAGTYAPLANQIAAEHRIPPQHRPYFVALIEQESSWDPNARHKNTDLTEDQGLGQFHTPYPNGVTLTNPFDPVQSLNAAAQYWNILRTYAWIGDDPIQIVAAYNGGPSGIRGGFSTAVQQHVAAVRARVPKYAQYAGGATVPPDTTPPSTAQAPAGTSTPSAPLSDAAFDALPLVQQAQKWAGILMAWYDMGGELFGGALTVRGHPAWNVGHRLLTSDERGEWEAYIEGVSHRYDMRTGQYLTQLRITRGWYLSAAIAAQLFREGVTTVTAASGGPPTLDPATGQPQKELTVTFPQHPEIAPLR
jgi:transglycosylase-like protein with SLT domain